MPCAFAQRRCRVIVVNTPPPLAVTSTGKPPSTLTDTVLLASAVPEITNVWSFVIPSLPLEPLSFAIPVMTGGRGREIDGEVEGRRRGAGISGRIGRGGGHRVSAFVNVVAV